MYFLTGQKLRVLSDQLEILSKQYKEADPFPHIVLDNFFDHPDFEYLVDAFPSPADTKWWKYDNALEKKLAKDDLEDLTPVLRHFIHELMEKRFCTFLEKLTGIKGLIVDQTLRGGGLHQIVTGGKLDIHADYNTHPDNGLDRRLNVLVYLNQDWKEEWNGHLELWDTQMTRCVKKIAPIYNRVVVFSTTDFTYHGHPEPLMCPEWASRKSIALYYYTNGRPEHEKTAPHSTLYKARPQDSRDPEIEILREKRAIARQGDLTT